MGCGSSHNSRPEERETERLRKCFRSSLRRRSRPREPASPWLGGPRARRVRVRLDARCEHAQGFRHTSLPSLAPSRPARAQLGDLALLAVTLQPPRPTQPLRAKSSAQPAPVSELRQPLPPQSRSTNSLTARAVCQWQSGFDTSDAALAPAAPTCDARLSTARS